MAGPGQACSICHEPDPSASLCAMQALQPQLSPSVTCHRSASHWHPAGSAAAIGGPIRRLPHQETLERICVSWKCRHCSFPSCKFRNICATSRQRGHKARDCQLDSSVQDSCRWLPQGWPWQLPGVDDKWRTSHIYVEDRFETRTVLKPSDGFKSVRTVLKPSGPINTALNYPDRFETSALRLSIDIYLTGLEAP